MEKKIVQIGRGLYLSDFISRNSVISWTTNKANAKRFKESDVLDIVGELIDRSILNFQVHKIK